MTYSKNLTLLYPYYEIKEITFEEKLGLKNQPCIIQEKKEGVSFCAITYSKKEKLFLYGDKRFFKEEYSTIDENLKSFLQENSSYIFYGFHAESNKANLKIFEFFDKSSRKHLFNFSLLKNQEKIQDYLIEPLYTGKFNIDLDSFKKNLVIRFPLQKVVCKYTPIIEA